MGAFVIVLGLDCESSGLSVTEDRIHEFGAVLFCMNKKVPLQLYSCFVRPSIPMPDDYVSPTGIELAWLNQYGVSICDAFGEIQKMATKAECVVAQNGINYDKPLIESELCRHNIQNHLLKSIHWVDTRYDLPFDYTPKSRHLNHLAADAGFINPFPHRALFDAMTCVRLASMYDFEKVLAHSKIPWVNVRIMTNFDQKQIAKDLRYSWDGRIWVKKVKEDQFEIEAAAAMARGVSVVKI